MYKLFSALFVAVVACGLMGTAMAKDKADKKGPAKTPEEMFKLLDKDGDGFLSKEEFVGKPKDDAAKEAKEKAFKAKDKDGDGKLSKDEFCAQPAGGKGKGKKNK